MRPVGRGERWVRVPGLVGAWSSVLAPWGSAAGRPWFAARGSRGWFLLPAPALWLSAGAPSAPALLHLATGSMLSPPASGSRTFGSRAACCSPPLPRGQLRASAPALPASAPPALSSHAPALRLSARALLASRPRFRSPLPRANSQLPSPRLRLPAPGSRASGSGSRLPAPGSPAPGSRLHEESFTPSRTRVPSKSQRRAAPPPQDADRAAPLPSRALNGVSHHKPPPRHAETDPCPPRGPPPD